MSSPVSDVRRSALDQPERPFRVLLTTFGSFGDLHPYIAVALELKRRGHEPVLATYEFYREKIAQLGIAFRPLRPDAPTEPAEIIEFVNRVMDLRKGPEFVFKQMFMPYLRESYEDTLAAAEGADVLVGHPLTFTTGMAAAKLGRPWVSSVLAPLSFFSAHDPPVLPAAPFLAQLRRFGPRFYRPLNRLLKWSIRSWGDPWHLFRQELGLPPAAHPGFEGQHSPEMVLAMFSGQLGSPQPDWPSRAHVTGFAFYDHDGPNDLAPEIESFLANGPAPIVFTLGSSAVLNPAQFFDVSVHAARRLGRRAILLVGRDGHERVPIASTAEIGVFEYAPYSELFPRAAAVVHQGGAGTTGQAMRAGRPMLVVPFAHDQPDNADRVCRLGIARTVTLSRYRTDRVVQELKQLLEPRYAERAIEVARLVNAERGAAGAAELLVQLCRARSQPHGER